MNISTAALAPEPSTASVACQAIRTGHDDCHARFYPARYQLVLSRAGHEEKVELGYSGSRLLERLLQAPGTVVSREELMSFAWSDRVVGQGSLNQQIYTLRQVLGDEKKREIIQTLPRRGYMLNPHFLGPLPEDEVEPEASDALPPPIAPVPSPAPPAEIRRPWSPLLAIAALLPLGLVLLALLAYKLLGDPRTYSNEVRIGNALITYIEQDEAPLRQLILDTRELTTRIASLAEQPVELILSKSADFYQLLCMRANGDVRWLMTQESQLSAVDDTMLRRCLP
ncbi:winged helix-turn-helix domain-containing protein [Zestomonas carbonaria]|uniref:OmpR/PhoB-type domain-containing protein n=1 Tax=Zestomonas carbonaria TaxID=2762745 RepID=A0A7U7ETK5_9GAMM|nr:winged helix-turn-helix domain-containing protein [Pseudomonas carbonaria]CAD5110225.1 hypothetical protein PSEWESI4_04543 [Pseudomonas carbonaria]